MVRKLLAFISVLAVLCLSGCAPAPESRGRLTAALTGGDANLGEYVNLREVTVEMQGDATLVRFNFINGSRNAGVEETKLSSVPLYSVEELADPPRLKISLAVGFVDYAEARTVFQGSAVDGVFDCGPPGTAREVYLQLASPVDVECSIDSATLTLTLTPRREEDARSAYYVGLNAIEGYENGLLPENASFTPTMCEGFGGITLISEPFDREEEAAQFRTETAAALPETIPQSALYAFEMRTDALPPDESTTDLAVASSIAVVERNGEQQLLPVLIDNGTYLTTAPDGTIFYAVPYNSGDEADSGRGSRQELWGRTPDGKESRYTRRTFYDIRQASVSHDGRYLGILDAQTAGQLLYVYDTAEGRLRNLGEEGFGDYTASFFWMPDEDVLYAMTGASSFLQLLKYDFGAPEDSSRISSVEEREGSDSQISYANGLVYYADQDANIVYAVDIETGQRSVLGEGVRCLVSPDGRYLAVLQMHIIDSVELTFDLLLCNAQTGEVEDVVQRDGGQIEDFMFSPRSSTLYLTSQDNAETSDEYPFALLKYSKRKLSPICASRTESILAAPEDGVLYLVYSFATGKDSSVLIPVTYTLQAGL